MPFGLTNAPQVFQSMMNDLFRPYLDKFVVVYIVDILIFSPNVPDHEKHVRTVLEILSVNKLYCKLTKCQFFQTQIDYLGYQISNKAISMDPRKVKVIEEWPTPDSVRAIQVFLGFANFYRRFIPRHSSKIKPMTTMLKKDVKFEWNSDADKAFCYLKKTFSSASILIHPNAYNPFILETDASDWALGGILSQYDEHKILKPVAFHSRQFTQAERNYDVYDKELLAIIDCFKSWRHLLQGGPQVFCDHKNITQLTNPRQLSRRQARWIEFLGYFDFAITHRSGISNKKTDLLSRHLPNVAPENENL